MECSKANELMMKYMDGTITESDADRLRKHITECETCKADFLIYDEIVSAFTELDNTPAPDGFVEAVMTKIEFLKPASAKASDKADGILLIVLGVFSVLFGLGFALVMNREAISAYLSAQPALAGYMETLAPFGVMVDEFAANIAAAAGSLFAQAASIFTGGRYIFLGIAVCLALASVVLAWREKSAAQKKS